MTGLLGGAFDPPHSGHLALAQRALEHFGLERLLVLVVAAPGHKRVETDVEDRLELTRLAFADLPRAEVVRDDHAYTVDFLREERPASDDTVFLVGADEFADFRTWREPEEVLRLVRVAVATRPGYPRELLDPILGALDHADGVEHFDIPPTPVSSSEIRARVRDGESIEGLVPESVAREIARRGLYRAV
ncbi:MAG TPA: nicotinate (nicotinamide) nucleotide adenylyltransferase [Gaiellaceae bacterium]|nr:nicotinate (nicotinamide) nucleotide adenylyltransferase [Gaiellaceae bacterium]